MGINLNFGINGYVAVQDMKDRELYRIPVQSEEEAHQWIKEHKAPVQKWGILKSSFVPMRVDNCNHLARDLFLPTFINRALKIHNLFLKVLASIVAIAWDVLTFPIRLIALPIRLCTASSANAHAVEKLIKESPHFEETKKHGVVRLVAHVEDVHFSNIQGRVPNDLATMRTFDASFDVLLKASPQHQEPNGTYGSNTKFFAREFPNGEWHPH
jgi:hypothetical protein